LLAAQGIAGYKPLRRDRRARLAELVSGLGEPLPVHLAVEIGRALERLELVMRQIREVENERQQLLDNARLANDPRLPDTGGGTTPSIGPNPNPSPSDQAVLLMRLKGVGIEGATTLAYECFFHPFANRRQVAAFAGLAATPWRSGQIIHEQGISKAGNPRLRTIMVELAWCWRRYQPNSALTQWWRQRLAATKGKHAKAIAVIALARKLLVALWRYVTQGIVPAGASFKAA